MNTEKEKSSPNNSAAENKITSELDMLISSIAVTITKTSQWIQKNEDLIEKLYRSMNIISVAEKDGWILHKTSPINLINKEIPSENITPIFNEYYEKNWKSVELIFINELDSIEIDANAKHVFREALQAHGSGLYRSCVRLLFPEIERVSREYLLERKAKRSTSLREIREQIGNLRATDIYKIGGFGTLGKGHKLFDHLYKTVETPEEIAKFSASPIPNRHAALHGLIDYNSLQSSLSMLIMAEFIFKAIVHLKLSAPPINPDRRN